MTINFVHYPRGFANEYTVFEVAAEDVAEFRDLFPAAEEIGAEEADRLTVSRPKEAIRSGEQWFANFHDEEGTRRLMDEKIAMRDGYY